MKPAITPPPTYDSAYFEGIAHEMAVSRERIAARLDAARACRTREEKLALIGRWKRDLQPQVVAETMTLLRGGWTGADYRIQKTNRKGNGAHGRQ